MKKVEINNFSRLRVDAAGDHRLVPEDMTVKLLKAYEIYQELHLDLIESETANLGLKLRVFRAIHGLNQEQFAKLADIEAKQVCDIETKKDYRPHEKTRKKIDEAIKGKTLTL